MASDDYIGQHSFRSLVYSPVAFLMFEIWTLWLLSESKDMSLKSRIRHS